MIEELKAELKLGDITLTSIDFINLAKEILQEESTTTTLANLKGTGEIHDPYLLSTPHDWLSAALRLKASNAPEEKSTYFNIGGRLIKYRHQDRYASDWTALKDLTIAEDALRRILSKKSTDAFSSWVLLNREKFAFIYKFFDEDQLKIILGKKPKAQDLNKILSFMSQVYFLANSCKTRSNAEIIIDAGKPILKFQREEIETLEQKFERLEGKKHNNAIELLEFLSKDTETSTPSKKYIVTYRIPFPFEITETKAKDFLNNFFDSQDRAKPTPLIYFSFNDGPIYPDIHDYLSYMFTWIVVWNELKGQQTAHAKANLAITTIVYKILSGANQTSGLLEGQKDIPLEGTIFHTLPLIIATFFLGEVGRNPISFLSGLVLLDVINKHQYLSQDVNAKFSTANNSVDKSMLREQMLPAYHLSSYFSWENFVWTKNSNNKDIYGNTLTNNTWGGIHPMAHEGSFAAEFKNDNWNINNPLTVTRQKEADLMIRWLEFKFETTEKISLEKILNAIDSIQQKKEQILDLIKILFKNRIKNFEHPVHQHLENPYQETLLAYAIRSAPETALKILGYLQKQNFNITEYLNFQDKLGITAFHMLAARSTHKSCEKDKNSYKKILRFFVEHNANPNIPAKGVYKNETAVDWVSARSLLAEPFEAFAKALLKLSMFSNQTNLPEELKVEVENTKKTFLDLLN